jgi:hypothetical protein
MKRPTNFVVVNTKPFDFKDPDFTEIDLKTIISGLDRISRFNGNTNRHYSVLEHSLLCLDIYLRACEKEILSFFPHTALAVLSHDFHEAIIGDIVGPVRSYLAGECEGFRNAIEKLENYVDKIIEEKVFKSELIYLAEEVFEIDMFALHVEHTHFFRDSKHMWTYPVSGRLVSSIPLSEISLFKNHSGNWINSALQERVIEISSILIHRASYPFTEAHIEEFADLQRLLKQKIASLRG